MLTYFFSFHLNTLLSRNSESPKEAVISFTNIIKENDVLSFGSGMYYVLWH